mmetsp:Transcript_12052/g.32575  ORF Transcript_12052/g.32575 Transcript_12052/m.32575 type:complete len:207 (+) Transcript_12052:220-840(+)
MLISAAAMVASSRPIKTLATPTASVTVTRTASVFATKVPVRPCWGRAVFFRRRPSRTSQARSGPSGRPHVPVQGLELGETPYPQRVYAWLDCQREFGAAVRSTVGQTKAAGSDPLSEWLTVPPTALGQRRSAASPRPFQAAARASSRARAWGNTVSPTCAPVARVGDWFGAAGRSTVGKSPPQRGCCQGAKPPSRLRPPPRAPRPV